MSQVALGSVLGVSAKTISRYENQFRFPRESFLWDLCKVLRCQSWQLFHPDPVQAERALNLVQSLNIPL